MHKERDCFASLDRSFGTLTTEDLMVGKVKAFDAIV
jgi:hypothetical protein